MTSQKNLGRTHRSRVPSAPHPSKADPTDYVCGCREAGHVDWPAIRTLRTSDRGRLNEKTHFLSRKKKGISRTPEILLLDNNRDCGDEKRLGALIQAAGPHRWKKTVEKRKIIMEGAKAKFGWAVVPGPNVWRRKSTSSGLALACSSSRVLRRYPTTPHAHLYCKAAVTRRLVFGVGKWRTICLASGGCRIEKWLLRLPMVGSTRFWI